MKIFCLSIYNKNYDQLKKLDLIPVGLGKETFGSKWLNDKGENNISEKIQILVNILFIIICGKTILSKKIIMNGLVFALIGDFGLKMLKKNFNPSLI